MQYKYIGNGGDVEIISNGCYSTIAPSFTRIVHGGRGDYVEFAKIYEDRVYIPSDAKWRLANKNAYYIEYRTTLGNIKIYFQLKPVDYADYKEGKYYISPRFLKDFVKTEG